MFGAEGEGDKAKRGRWGVAAAVSVATVAVEVLQPLTGRGFDLWDAAAGCAGVAATTVLWGRPFGWLAGMLAVLAVGCMARGIVRLGQEWWLFPTLADGGGGCWSAPPRESDNYP